LRLIPRWANKKAQSLQVALHALGWFRLKQNPEGASFLARFGIDASSAGKY
jgi:hypothetical protein